MIGLALALGLVVLILHVLAVCLSWALRTYSRSRLEEICEDRGHAERADLIDHDDERTERAAEALGTITGLTLAALLGVIAGWLAPSFAVEAVIAIALLIAALGHLAAGITGRVYAEEVLDALWPLTGVLRTLLAPLSNLMRAIETLAYRRSSRFATVPRPASIEVEFEAEHDDSEEEREVELPESTREMMERAIELTRRDVDELMTPRSAILTLPATVEPREAARAFADSGYSRIPLYGENRDDIVGILYAKDLYARLLAAGEDDRSLNPRKLARPPLYIPESKNAADLLTEFQKRQIQVAIVLDEYGGVSGLITLEDLLEELVGEIIDEHDVANPEDPLKQIDESTYEVDATLSIEALNDQLGLRLPTDQDYTTVGGLAFSTLGHLPAAGASFVRDRVAFTVMRVEGRSIRRLRLNLHPSESESASPFSS